MSPSLTSAIIAVKPRIAVTARWIYQKTFSAKDRIAFYDMLAFLLDNNKSLQQALIDMRNVVTDFGRKHHPYAVLLTDCLSTLDEGQGAFEKVLLEWVPVQEATLIGSGILYGKLSDTLRRASQFNESAKQYIADHRDELLNQPLPYRITPSLLIKNGYLQQGFAEKNGLGQQYVTGVVKNNQKNPVRYRRSPVAYRVIPCQRKECAALPPRSPAWMGLLMRKISPTALMADGQASRVILASTAATDILLLRYRRKFWVAYCRKATGFTDLR
nr:type II secretion system F family protein [Sodalis glossinidius]